MSHSKRKKSPTCFLIDEIDVETYFFLNFFDIYTIQNKVLVLSKSFSTEIYSNEDFFLNFGYQRLKLAVEFKERIFFF